tara:strand:- start:182 stop:337 length:156 start_codon:yes stop_codon:yes gene_type:complete
MALNKDKKRDKKKKIIKAIDLSKLPKDKQKDNPSDKKLVIRFDERLKNVGI